MFVLLLSGDGTVLEVVATRAQLPLLLAQASNVTTVSVGQATEDDTALAITVVLSGASIVQVGLASEDDSALAMIVVVPPSDLFVNVGLTSTTETAQTISFVASGDVFVSIGLVQETGSAFPITFSQTFLLPHVDRDDITLTSHPDSDLTLTPVEVE